MPELTISEPELTVSVLLLWFWDFSATLCHFWLLLESRTREDWYCFLADRSEFVFRNVITHGHENQPLVFKRATGGENVYFNDRCAGHESVVSGSEFISTLSPVLFGKKTSSAGERIKLWQDLMVNIEDYHARVWNNVTRWELRGTDEKLSLWGAKMCHDVE